MFYRVVSPCSCEERILELTKLVQQTIEEVGWPTTYKYEDCGRDTLVQVEIRSSMSFRRSRMHIPYRAPMDRHVIVGGKELVSDVQRDWIICHELTHAYTTPYYLSKGRQREVEDYADMIADKIVVGYSRVWLLEDITNV